MFHLNRGDIVMAVQNLDASGANVDKGDIGVCIGEANCFGDNCGPLIRWMNGQKLRNTENPLGGICNVYEGDVEVVYEAEL